MFPRHEESIHLGDWVAALGSGILRTWLYHTTAQSTQTELGPTHAQPPLPLGTGQQREMLPSQLPGTQGHSGDRAHRRHFADDVPGDGQAPREGAGGHEGSRHLQLELARHVPEGLQLLRVFADTLQVLVREVVLGVHQPEHALQQARPELVEHLLQVDIAAHVVALQLHKEVLEQLRVLHVQPAVRPHKHVVQRLLSVLQELFEEL